jgi:serine/threonine-protein kinase
VASTPLGRYEVLKQLAKGALTELLLARATGIEGFQRHVAIKRLLPQYTRDAKCVEAFVNEARLAAALHHHNIVQVHDIGEHGGQPYFAMEYVHGVDLRTLLAKLAKRNEQLPLQHVVQIVASAAAALHHAHEQRGPDGQPLGLIHRDVTPGNILVGYDGNVKVVDFGIAKAAIKRIHTDSGVLKGQAPYMSPEQCTGKTLDRRSDIWALGVVLYELATVRRLFKGASEFLTMSAIVNAEVPKPSQYRRDIPPQLEAIMLKALTRDPAQRYQSAGDMSLALDQVASTVGVGASTTALANYMRLQFGEQKEPWLATPDFEEETENTEVDFDGAASGLAPPPSESVQRNAIPRVMAATKSSPIAAAREHALTPLPPEKPRLPLPAPRSRTPSKLPPMPNGVPIIAVHPRADTDAKTDVKDAKRVATDLDVPRETAAASSVAAPPKVTVRPSALQVAQKRPSQTIPTPDASATAIVEPLPTTYPQYIVPGGRKRSRRALWVALFAMVFAGTAVAIVMWPSNDAAPSAAPAEVAKAEPSATPGENKPVETQPTQEPKQTTPAEEPKPAAPAEEPKPAPAAEPPKPAEPEKPPADKAAPADDTPKSGMQMTMADYEKARAAAAPPAPPAEKPAKKEPPAPPAVKEVAKISPTPKRTTTTKPPAKKTVAKAAAKPATKSAKKPTKKPKWNPDDLFLEDK